MRKIAALLLFLAATAGVKAQQSYEVEYNVPIVKAWVVDFSEEESLKLSVLKSESAAPEVGMTSSAVKADLDARRQRKLSPHYKTSPYSEHSIDLNPVVNNEFNGKPLGSAGIPNDNTLAVSNGGIVISAINTTVTILDEDGNLLKYRTLAGIVAGKLGLLDRFYDPKVLYDPEADRFILVFLEGSNSSDTRIIVGFTQTPDPTGLWNFYQINGKPLGGTTWSDYPIVAHNSQDLYITVNLLRDNESWQEGFVESFIWQINKADGYQGDTLTQNLFHDIKYNGKSVWSICPVQPVRIADQKDMYFLSVRPGDAANDSVFLHYIDGPAKSGTAQHSLEVLRNTKPYGVPPSAFQPTLGFRLQTNDARVLSATQFNGTIHYVQSTLIPSALSSGVYHGMIRNLRGFKQLSSNYIQSDRLDYAYPSISHTGLLNDDLHALLITFSHSGEQDYPGTSVVFHNGVGSLQSLYSEVIKVKKGDSVINSFLADSIERWGDYTDIQRQYNKAGVVWLAGSYGDETGRNNVWIAQINAKEKLEIVEGIITYPNPASSAFKVSANFKQEDHVDLFLVDTKGAVVQELRDQFVMPSATEFIVDTRGLHMGVYVLYIKSSEGEILHSSKVLVQ